MNITKEIALIGLILISFSCKKEEPVATVNTLGSAEAVSNDPDDLDVGYGSFSNVVDEKTYSYVCTTQNNELSIGGTLSSGSALVTVKSESGSTLFSQNFTSFMAANPDLTAPAGTWTVNVKLTNASGSVAISLKKIP